MNRRRLASRPRELPSMPKRNIYVLALGTVLLAIAALGFFAWLVSSVNELHERFAGESRGLGLAFLVVLIVLLAIAAIWLGWLAWRTRAGRPEPTPVPTDVIRAASVQTDQAEGVIRQVKDESARAELNRELGELRAGRELREFHLVIFGTGSAGKTSLINALMGRDVGKTEAVMGTTQHAESHTYSMDGVDGRVFLTDTPGLSEIGTGGAAREQEARGLATKADLLIFVLDHDLIRTEFEPLSALVRQGKRSIVLLNKTDRFSDEDRDAILAKLRERLRGLVAADDVVAGAAAPRPIAVRARRADGSTETTLEEPPPDLAALRDRIARILHREGDVLRAGQPVAPSTLAQPQGAGSDLQGAGSEGRGRDREIPVDDRGHRVHQPVPGPGIARQRRRAVPDDYRAGRRLRSDPLDLERPDVRHRDGPDALEARPGRGRHLADRRDLQVIAGRIRGRWGRAGRLDGLPHPYFRRDVRRILPARPDLGRRRTPGRLDPAVRPDQPHGVPPGIRQAGGPKSLQPVPAGIIDVRGVARGKDSGRCRNSRMSTMSETDREYPRLFPKPEQTIAGIGRAIREGRRHLCGRPQPMPGAGRSLGAQSPRLGRAGPRGSHRAGAVAR